MSRAWNQRSGETGKAHSAFVAYLALGLNRSLAKTAAGLGRPEGYASVLKRWSVQHRWVDRAAAYDSEQLRRDLDARGELLERKRARFVVEADAAIDTIVALMKGRLPEGGSMEPLLDRHGQPAGERPTVTAGERRKAAEQVLGQAGLTVERRLKVASDGATAEARLLRESIRSVANTNPDLMDELCSLLEIER